MDKIEIETIWLDSAAEDLFRSYQALVNEIRASYEVPAINATAFQIAIFSMPGERRKAAERIEAQCRPLREAMAALIMGHTAPAIVKSERES